MSALENYMKSFTVILLCLLFSLSVISDVSAQTMDYVFPSTSWRNTGGSHTQYTGDESAYNGIYYYGTTTSASGYFEMSALSEDGWFDVYLWSFSSYQGYQQEYELRCVNATYNIWIKNNSAIDDFELLWDNVKLVPPCQFHALAGGLGGYSVSALGLVEREPLVDGRTVFGLYSSHVLASWLALALLSAVFAFIGNDALRVGVRVLPYFLFLLALLVSEYVHYSIIVVVMYLVVEAIVSGFEFFKKVAS